MARRVDPWFLAGYAGIAGFGVLEATLRSPESAADLRAGSEDQGTTRVLAAGYAGAALLAPLLRRLPVGRLPESSKPLGVVLQLVGLGLRAWAMRTLAGAYSRTLRVTNTQDVVEAGPYRYIRHPGYLGAFLTWLGFALTSGSPVVTAGVVGLLVPIYQRRIVAEEALLADELDGYQQYSGRTRRLVPYVW
jgi:protein-S-isoprenylcysteine O-methyltransferase Ste14